jgi:cephalosporin hydroxylase
MQVEEENEWLQNLFIKLKPKVVVEIGSHYGGSLWFWIKDAVDDATIVSVDIGTWNPYGRLPRRKVSSRRRRWRRWLS